MFSTNILAVMFQLLAVRVCACVCILWYWIIRAYWPYIYRVFIANMTDSRVTDNSLETPRPTAGVVIWFAPLQPPLITPPWPRCDLTRGAIPSRGYTNKHRLVQECTKSNRKYISRWASYENLLDLSQMKTIKFWFRTRNNDFGFYIRNTVL